MFHGEGTFVCKTQEGVQTLTGYFEHGVLHNGIGTSVHANGETFTSSFVNGSLAEV